MIHVCQFWLVHWACLAVVTQREVSLQSLHVNYTIAGLVDKNPKKHTKYEKICLVKMVSGFHAGAGEDVALLVTTPQSRPLDGYRRSVPARKIPGKPVIGIGTSDMMFRYVLYLGIQ